jgi:hypothetical protein
MEEYTVRATCARQSYWICLVSLVCLVYLVLLAEQDQLDQLNQPDEPANQTDDRPEPSINRRCECEHVNGTSVHC